MVRVIEEKFGKLLCSRNPESLCDFFFFTYDVFTREYFVQLHVQLDKYYVECVKCGLFPYSGRAQIGREKASSQQWALLRRVFYSHAKLRAGSQNAENVLRTETFATHANGSYTTLYPNAISSVFSLI